MLCWDLELALGRVRGVEARPTAEQWVLRGTYALLSYCNDEVWEDPARNLRVVGVLPRNGAEWQALYAKRRAIERTFKSLKQSRRLERHYTRGLRRITLHCYVAMLAYQATALVTAQQSANSRLRWMVEKVA